MNKKIKNCQMCTVKLNGNIIIYDIAGGWDSWFD